MSDAKYFHRGKVHELQSELSKESKPLKKKKIVKKIIANLTMGNDMLPLAQDLLALLSIEDLELKKMIYLFIVTYCKVKPEIALTALPLLIKDTNDVNPLIRTLAIRTITNIPVDKVIEASKDCLQRALVDKDPLVCKTAATSIAKLFSYNPEFVINSGLLSLLKNLIQHHNSAVIANAVTALMDIASNSQEFEFSVNVATANRLLTALDESNEWSQIFILEAIMTVEPDDPTDAELIIERVTPRLQHSNTGVVMATVRLMLYLSNYLVQYQQIDSVLKKCSAPLVTLLNNTPEIQFVALRNIQLILQKHPDFTTNVQVFFCKYQDPIYVKLTKLDILSQLATPDNVFTILPELKDYTQEVDVDFVRRAVRAIGRCAVKMDVAANKCIEILVAMVQTKIDYVVQEAVIVIKDIFRKYPNRFESIISILCDNLQSLEEPEAKASMIWIIGQYSDRIENAHELLEEFLETFQDDQPVVQLALLTAIVKLFIKRPGTGQKLVPKVLKLSTEEIDSPDVRDRGFMYWRMLSTNPVMAKEIVLGEKPLISTESEGMDPSLLSRILYCVSKLSLIQQKPTPMSQAFAQKLARLHAQSLQVLASRPITTKAEKVVSPVQQKPKIAPDYNPYDAIIQTEIQVPQKATPLGGLPIDLFFGSIDDQQPSPDIDIYQKYQGLESPTLQAVNLQPSVVEENRNAQNTLIDIMNQQRNSEVAVPVVESRHNPFLMGGSVNTVPPVQAMPVMNTMQAMAPMNTMQSMQTMQNMQPKAPMIPQQISSNPNATIDPFQKTSVNQAQSPVQSISTQMQGMSISGTPSPIVHLLQSHMNPQQLDVHGSFIRQNSLFFNLTFTNKSTQPLYDFAILFNKNTYF